MSINLLEKVQQDLGYPALKKIDPNNQDPHHYQGQQDSLEFAQAAIPTVLTGMYRFVQSDEGAATFLNVVNATNWLDEIFEEHKDAAVQMVANYANRSEEAAAADMNAIANEAVKIAKQNITDPNIKTVKSFFEGQKNTILLYLPPEVHAGDALHDPELDDRTNKMEGPISSLIKSIGAAFSNPVTKEDTQK